MSSQAKGGWRPPTMDSILWQCPECDEYNDKDLAKCRKCGAPKPAADNKEGASKD